MKNTSDTEYEDDSKPKLTRVNLENSISGLP